jgi:hypothetical protein
LRCSDVGTEGKHLHIGEVVHMRDDFREASQGHVVRVPSGLEQRVFRRQHQHVSALATKPLGQLVAVDVDAAVTLFDQDQVVLRLQLQSDPRDEVLGTRVNLTQVVERGCGRPSWLEDSCHGVGSVAP